jgi:type 2A phosphatase activator TIP41
LGWLNTIFYLIFFQKDIQKERPTKRVYDWTYKTRYLGSPEGNFKIQEDPKAKINTEMLQRREPIQYYRDIRLFDDELDDNGMATLHVKTRVMPSCYLVLLRYFLRVDRGKNDLYIWFFSSFSVKVKLCDCRVFHKFGSNEVIREYTEKSAEWTYLTNTRRVPVNHTTTPEAVDQYLQLDYKYSDRIIFE